MIIADGNKDKNIFSIFVTTKKEKCMIGKGQPKKQMENSELKRMQERARRFRINKDKFKVQKLVDNYYHFDVKLTNY